MAPVTATIQSSAAGVLVGWFATAPVILDEQKWIVVDLHIDPVSTIDTSGDPLYVDIYIMLHRCKTKVSVEKVSGVSWTQRIRLKRYWTDGAVDTPNGVGNPGPYNQDGPVDCFLGREGNNMLIRVSDTPDTFMTDAPTTAYRIETVLYTPSAAGIELQWGALVHPGNTTTIISPEVQFPTVKYPTGVTDYMQGGSLHVFIATWLEDRDGLWTGRAEPFAGVDKFITDKASFPVIGTRCVVSLVSDCQCAYVAMDPNTTALDDKGRMIDSMVIDVNFAGTDYMATAVNFPDSLERAYPQYFGEDGLSSNWGRQLLGIGTDFVFKFQEDVVTLDAPVETCGECTYTISIMMSNGLSITAPKTGIFTSVDLPEEIKSRSGKIYAYLIDGIGNVIYADVDERLGKNVCTTYDCFMCWENLQIFDCLSSTHQAMIIIVFIAIGIVAMSSVLVACSICSERFSMCCERCCKAPCFRCCKKKQPEELVVVMEREMREPLKKKRFASARRVGATNSVNSGSTVRRFCVISLLAITTGCIQADDDCSNGLFIPVEYANCGVSSAYKTNCTMSLNVVGTIPSNGESFCINIGNPSNDEPLGLLKIAVDITYVQSYAYQYATSEYKFLSSSKHFCDHSGPCGDIDGNINSGSDPYGIFMGENWSLMLNPGITSYHESAGCWANGCFYCSSACTYTRVAFDTLSFQPHYVHIKDGEPKRILNVVATYTEADGVTVSTLYEGKMSINEIVVSGGFEFKFEGQLLGENRAWNFPDYVITTADCTVNKVEGYDNVVGRIQKYDQQGCRAFDAFAASSAAVSSVNAPVRGKIGDIQFPRVPRNLGDFNFAQDLYQCQIGKYDKCLATESGMTNRDAKVDYRLPGAGFSIFNPGLGVVQLQRQEAFLSDPMLTSVRSTEDITFRNVETTVCPTGIKDAEYEVTGEYGSNAKCYLRAIVWSECEAGVATIKENESSFQPTSNSVMLRRKAEKPEEGNVILIAGFCAAEVLPSSVMQICIKGKCAYIKYAASVLSPVQEVYSGTTTFANGTVTVGDMSGKGSWSFGDLNLGGVFGPVLGVLGAILGKPGDVASSIGALILLFAAALLLVKVFNTVKEKVKKS